MSEKKKWLHFANVLMSKDKEDDQGNVIKGHPYIEVIQDVTIPKGSRVVMKTKLSQLKSQLDAGFIDKERYDYLVEKLGFIKYELLLPPGEE